MGNDERLAELYSPQLEEGLVACALIDRDAFLLDLAPADFHNRQLADIWAAGQALTRSGVFVDSILLQETLAAQGQQLSLTLIAKLSALGVFSGNAPTYAEKVRELARRRAVRDGLEAAARAIHDGSEAWRGDAVGALEFALAVLQPTPAEAGEPGTWADLAAQLGPITFDWERWLAPAFLHMLVSSSGEGKSNLALRVCASYLVGWPWPDGTPFTHPTGKVLWCEAEAAQGMNMQRARAWGLPLEGILSPLADPLGDVNFFEPHHRAAVAECAARADVRLVVVDSLSGACGGRERAEEQMPVVKWLAELARDTGKPVLVLHHLRKRGLLDSAGDPITLDRVRGSTVIVQLARIVWAIDTPDPNQASERRLTVIKSNLAEFPPALGLQIDAAGIEFGDAPQKARPDTPGERAAALLAAVLADGPRPVSEVQAAADEAGVSWETMKRAKRRMGVAARRNGETGVWSWALTRQATED